MTYPEAAIIGLIQGVTELFPVSSLGHSVLIPALAGGSWAKDLDAAAPSSPYLAFVVGLHVATAIGMLIYFWRDWLRIIGAFFSSIAHRQARTADERLAWMIIFATIPVGLVGLAADHETRVLFAKPVLAGVFLIVNGAILFAGERFRPQRGRDADRELEEQAAGGQPVRSGAAHASGQRALRQQELSGAIRADRRLAAMSYAQATLIGTVQILALLAGISRDGIAMVAGLYRGLAREDAARFAFLLATPVILAAGLLEVPKLTGPLGHGIHGQILVGSVLAGLGAYVSVRFLTRYFQTRSLTPFAIYCVIFGLFSVIYLSV
ncbi:MAG TPA: undecaprenyl-diphosphate phosphatase [Streptosporangiaceae bacterium]|nr:undecaprenyl-diphosphate phosphatase [Streptosporangiaceae bacterium]